LALSLYNHYHKLDCLLVESVTQLDRGCMEVTKVHGMVNQRGDGCLIQVQILITARGTM